MHIKILSFFFQNPQHKQYWSKIYVLVISYDDKRQSLIEGQSGESAAFAIYHSLIADRSIFVYIQIENVYPTICRCTSEYGRTVGSPLNISYGYAKFERK